MSRQVRRRLTWASIVSLLFCVTAWVVTAFVPGPARIQAQSTDTYAEREEAVADWEASLVADRREAEDLMANGRLVEAVAAVAACLRRIPPEYPELADTACSLAQLSNFILEYLMDDAARETVRSEVLRPEVDEMGRFLWRVFEIYLGLDTEPKTKAARELDRLTGSTNPLVRIGALFTLSQPYCFDNAGFVGGRCAALGRDYPDLALSQAAIEVMECPDYDAPMETWNTAIGVASSITALKAGEEVPDAPADASTRAVLYAMAAENPFLVRIREVAQLARQDSAQARAHLADGIRNGANWRVRYGCTAVTGRAVERERPSELLAACQALAERTENMPDVFLARVIMSRAARSAPDGSKETVTYWTNRLLEMELEVFPTERNAYEEVLRNLQATAQWLAEHGDSVTAVAWYQEIAARFPNSTAARDSESAVAELMVQR